ncbi:MAG TPA: universal stress protein [Gemmatimonadaceae bacterium]|nr:universal stress protein [Gemmatimonadaceae bacterium]
MTDEPRVAPPVESETVAAPALPERRAQPRPPGTGQEDFLQLVQQRERGKLKVYVGSAAGTGKTYRMLQEGNDLRRRGVDVVVGFHETHGRADTEAQVDQLEIVPRKKISYRGVTLEEMDVDAVIARKPTVAVVDELAHTNVPGAGRLKRWEDVMTILDAGINVISAVNVQHLESLNDVIQEAIGVTVRETVPDWVVASADQLVNLDIPAEDLRQRLREGKIYPKDKIETSLANFFTEENLSTLRELALREVASSVERSREAIAQREAGAATADRTGKSAVDRVLVAMSSNPPYTAMLLRKASRIAGRLNSDWYCVYVQTQEERADRIDTAIQRKLVDNIQMAQRLGAETVKLVGEDVADELCRFAKDNGVTLIIAGQSRRSAWDKWRRGSVTDALVHNRFGLDVLIVSLKEKAEP